MSSSPLQSVRAAAAVLRTRGFAVCKPDAKEKKPTYRGWSARSLEVCDFTEGEQIGVIGGPLSNGNTPEHALVVIDLDSAEAVAHADEYLPATGMSEGRPSKQQSHRYYLVPFSTIPDWALSSADQAAAAAKRNTGHPGAFLKHFADRETGKGCIDFIGTGGQVVCPPAAHPSGERREWCGGVPGVPAVVGFPELWQAVCELASACGAAVPDVVPRPPRGRGEHVATGAVERARKYLAECPASVSGHGGHKALMWASRVLVYGFDLGAEQAYHLIATEFNPRCQPEWSEKELRHKIEDADRIPFTRPLGWLRDQEGPSRDDRTGGSASVGTDRPEESRFEFIDSAVFLAGDYRPRWLIPRILVRGQPGVIAGPSKGMKTSTVVDAVVSLATATPFLGTFPVHQRVRTALVSGESGEHTLKETCLRVLAARGVAPAELSGWLKWEFSLPTFSDPESMRAFGEGLARIEADVVVIDPTYLALGDVDAKNLFEMGRALKSVAGVLGKLRPDLTVILVHHANRLLPIGEVMELQHLAYSGLEQFARQFILLNRRGPYRNDGEHDLWVRVGGSAGHGGLWAVHVSEGLVDEDFAGRRWCVSVETFDKATEAVATEAGAAKRDRRLNDMRADERAVIGAVEAEQAGGRAGANIRRIRDLTAFSHDRASAAVGRLEAGGALVPVEFLKAVGNTATRSVKGWARPTQ